ncbi:MAG: hypothetical protein LBD29_01220 [Treponema sp.]|jgi:hypothetical protein|nr:hypothetical protein [Treponema sp.]
MKKIVSLVLTAGFIAVLFVSCVTKKKNPDDGYDRYERNRNAAVDASGRMDNAMK